MDRNQSIYMDEKLYKAASVKGSKFPTIDYENEAYLLRTPGDGSNIIHVAAKNGNNGFIDTILQELPYRRYHLLCQRNSKGETPLHLAAMFGHMDIVKSLIMHHVDQEQLSDEEKIYENEKKPCWSERDNRGDLPLHKALRSGHSDIAHELLKDSQLVSLYPNLGENLSLYNTVGESPAYLAADNFCTNFLKEILDDDHYSKYPPSFSGPFGQTVFHPARRLPVSIMSTLIERRKSLLKVRDDKGKTVLHYAVEEKREEVVKTLLKADSSLAYLHDNDGLTPLHRAAKLGFYGMIRIIVELSPQSITIHTGKKLHGKTALHLALTDASCLKKCLKNNKMKELINIADNDGNTPLHLSLISSEFGNADQVLIKAKGINWRLKNKDGYDPMDLCKSAKNRTPFYLSPTYIALRDLELEELKLGTKWQRKWGKRMSTFLRLQKSLF